MGIAFFRLAISLNKCLEIYAMYTERTLSSMAIPSFVILSFCKDLNFIIIYHKYAIHDAPYFACLYFE